MRTGERPNKVEPGSIVSKKGCLTGGTQDRDGIYTMGGVSISHIESKKGGGQKALSLLPGIEVARRRHEKTIFFHSAEDDGDGPQKRKKVTKASSLLISPRQEETW